MSVNRIKKSKVETEQRNNLIINRMMAMFVVATVAVVAVLMLKKNGGRHEVTFVLNVLPILQIISGILFAGATAFFIVRKVNKTDESLIYLSSPTLLILAAALFGSCMLYTTIKNAYVVIGIIGLLVISFVYNFFQRDYFWYSIFQVAYIVMILAIKITSVQPLWMQSFMSFSKIFIFVLPVLIVIGLLITKKNSGIFKFGKFNVPLMKPRSIYYPFYIGAGAAVASGIISILFANMAIYAIIALFALYLIFGIIYAVKMI
ncbi:MAG: hypothetical protein FWF15_02245 [Oscillospiraceae bacterium]|nr:hypothetical protein [Oscillospiraceae bacterium]